MPTEHGAKRTVTNFQWPILNSTTACDGGLMVDPFILNMLSKVVLIGGMRVALLDPAELACNPKFSKNIVII